MNDLFRKAIMREVKRQQLSGYRLGKMSGVPMRAVQRYVAGDADLLGARLSKVATALGLELRPVKRKQR